MRLWGSVLPDPRAILRHSDSKSRHKRLGDLKVNKLPAVEIDERIEKGPGMKALYWSGQSQVTKAIRQTFGCSFCSACRNNNADSSTLGQ